MGGDDDGQILGIIRTREHIHVRYEVLTDVDRIVLHHVHVVSDKFKGELTPGFGQCLPQCDMRMHNRCDKFRIETYGGVNITDVVVAVDTGTERVEQRKQSRRDGEAE